MRLGSFCTTCHHAEGCKSSGSWLVLGCCMSVGGVRHCDVGEVLVGQQVVSNCLWVFMYYYHSFFFFFFLFLS